jgi:sigma-B regulation protein RsbU (phosphoserine phosphatase)
MKVPPATAPLPHAPRILICSPRPERVESLHQLLREENYETRSQRIGDSRPDEAQLATFHLIIIDSPREEEMQVLGFCRELRDVLEERFVPVLYLTENTDHTHRVFSAEVGADGHLVLPYDHIELMSHIKTFVRIKTLQDRVVEQAAELRRMNRRIELAYDLIDKELDLARKIQQSFLPQFLPNIPRVHFAVKMEVCGRVGGDFYDVIRLDERTLGFYVADAMGHGVPASLLTIYVKKGIVPKDVFDNGYRLVKPGQVLHRLNIDMIQQQLSENPFVSMVYASLDIQTLKLTIARAGHPYPILLKPDGSYTEVRAEGTLLGIFETSFDDKEMQLEKGDRLLIYTDGIDSVRYKGLQQGFPSFIACVIDNASEPIAELIDNVYQTLYPDAKHDDDFTLFGMQIT